MAQANVLIPITNPQAIGRAITFVNEAERLGELFKSYRKLICGMEGHELLPEFELLIVKLKNPSLRPLDRYEELKRAMQGMTQSQREAAGVLLGIYLFVAEAKIKVNAGPSMPAG